MGVVDEQSTLLSQFAERLLIGQGRYLLSSRFTDPKRVRAIQLMLCKPCLCYTPGGISSYNQQESVPSLFGVGMERFQKADK